MKKNYNNIEPFWNGKVSSIQSVAGFYYGEIGAKIPFAIMIHGSEDSYIPIFSTEAMYNDRMEIWKNHIGPLPVAMRQLQNDDVEFLITQTQKLSPSVKARIMIDPEIISETHTRWIERIKVGDAHKYIQSLN